MYPPGLENCASWEKRETLGFCYTRANNEWVREQRVELMLLTEIYWRRGCCSWDTLDGSLFSIVFKRSVATVLKATSRSLKYFSPVSLHEKTHSLLKLHVGKGSGGLLKYIWKTQASICLPGAKFWPVSDRTNAAAVKVASGSPFSVGVLSVAAVVLVFVKGTHHFLLSLNGKQQVPRKHQSRACFKYVQHY